METPLSDSNIDLINSCLRKKKNDMMRKFTNVLSFQTLHFLQPTKWISDEIITVFLLMLHEKKGKPCMNSHFLPSTFFFALEEGWSTHGAVSKADPKGDIFDLDTLFIPINIKRNHWTLAVLYMKEKRMVYLDSKYGDGINKLNMILLYLQSLRESSSEYFHDWELVNNRNIPFQDNDFDCGLYCMLNAAYIFLGYPLNKDSFNDHMIKKWEMRKRISLTLITGKFIDQIA